MSVRQKPPGQSMAATAAYARLLSFGDRRAERCDAEHTAAGGGEVPVRHRRAGMEDGDAGQCLGRIDAADRAALFVGAGIAARRHDDAERRFVPPGRAHVGQAALGRRRHQVEKVAAESGHQGLAFGIAEADVVFDQLGAVSGQHQADEEHAAKGRAAPGHDSERRMDDLVHDPLDRRRIHCRSR